MKYILMLLLLSLNAFSQTYTNGVFVSKGNTIEVDKIIKEFTPKENPDFLSFSDGLVTRIDTNSDFIINSFFQEVFDIDTLPHKANFGDSDLSTTLNKGSAVFIYSGGNSNSYCVISTPFTDLELHKGIFYVKVFENRVIAFVLDESLKSHGDKNKENVVTSGYVIAIPNDVGILEDKISLGSEKVKQSSIDALLKDENNVIIIKDDIIFSVVNKKVIGIVIN